MPGPMKLMAVAFGVMFVITVVVMVIHIMRERREEDKRREALRALARRLGLTFSLDDPLGGRTEGRGSPDRPPGGVGKGIPGRFGQFWMLSTSRVVHTAYYVLWGRHRDREVMAFDYGNRSGYAFDGEARAGSPPGGPASLPGRGGTPGPGGGPAAAPGTPTRGSALGRRPGRAAGLAARRERQAKAERERYERFSAVVMTLGCSFPRISISPETAADRVLGAEDIDFESNEFSRRFYVTSSERKLAYEIIHTGMMEYLLSRQGWTLELNGTDAIIWNGRRWSPEQFGRAIDVLHGFLDRVPRFVWKELGEEREAGRL